MKPKTFPIVIIVLLAALVMSTSFLGYQLLQYNHILQRQQPATYSVNATWHSPLYNGFQVKRGEILHLEGQVFSLPKGIFKVARFTSLLPGMDPGQPWFILKEVTPDKNGDFSYDWKVPSNLHSGEIKLSFDLSGCLYDDCSIQSNQKGGSRTGIIT